MCEMCELDLDTGEFNLRDVHGNIDEIALRAEALQLAVNGAHLSGSQKLALSALARSVAEELRLLQANIDIEVRRGWRSAQAQPDAAA